MQFQVDKRGLVLCVTYEEKVQIYTLQEIIFRVLCVGYFKHRQDQITYIHVSLFC